MKRAGRIMIYVVGTLGLLVVLTGCAWVYMTSNVEEAPYDVVAADGDIERRAYPALIAAEVKTSGTRYDAVRSGFGPLARYIFARERDGEKIAMTAPVTQQPDAEDRWTIGFIMPAKYELANLPAPVQGQVTLTPLPPVERAAIRFSGVATDDSIAAQEEALRAWIAERGYETVGAPIYAYYNDPWTPGFLRRNEVLIDIRPPS